MMEGATLATRLLTAVREVRPGIEGFVNVGLALGGIR